ncbi:hypothetical protein [Actibacterium sp. 188UL27-1]|uniref:hypothetical protein n=1 Tax=Actibacterium sp. 188UL27-1 TaxID=2786961 RepID=UPI00195B3B37|nr:hypothetical protein [Actibacterium sp. 188UL27-1]MBM7068546.1 hypothetical protein [Actibacterium sp. 188UL27-1]
MTASVTTRGAKSADLFGVLTLYPLVLSDEDLRSVAFGLVARDADVLSLAV